MQTRSAGGIVAAAVHAPVIVVLKAHAVARALTATMRHVALAALDVSGTTAVCWLLANRRVLLRLPHCRHRHRHLHPPRRLRHHHCRPRRLQCRRSSMQTRSAGGIVAAAVNALVIVVLRAHAVARALTATMRHVALVALDASRITAACWLLTDRRCTTSNNSSENAPHACTTNTPAASLTRMPTMTFSIEAMRVIGCGCLYPNIAHDDFPYYCSCSLIMRACRPVS